MLKSLLITNTYVSFIEYLTKAIVTHRNQSWSKFKPNFI